MRRRLIALAALVCLLSWSAPAEAWWGHCGWGGYRGCGWRGWGCGPCFSVGYFPAYGGYCYPYSYGYGTALSVGYYRYPPYGAYYSPAGTLIVADPPASLNYGPLAVQQFLGMNTLRPVAPAATPIAAAKPAASGVKIVERSSLRLSNPEARRTAERLIEQGDALFRVQNFNSALQKYKLAASTAPDVAEAYWRQGHALVAVRQYDLATTAFKRAIALTDDLARSGFKLDDLYAGAALTKTEHLESLAELALGRSRSSDPYFLIGVFLHFDGQAGRAEKFFHRAAELAGISGGHIAVFLAPAAEPRPAPEAAAFALPVSAATEI